MQRLSKSVVLLCVGASLACLSCSYGGGGGSVAPVDNITVLLTPQLTSIAAGSSQQFTAVLGNPAATVQWYVSHGNVGANSAFGSITQSGLHVAPPTPPVYDNMGGPTIQGSEQISVFAHVNASGTQHEGQGNASQIIVVTAPSVTAGFVTPVATVALGQTFRFQPYAVGALDTSYSLQVQGAPGGSTTFGTITQNTQYAGLYTAPLVMPASGKTVTVTVVSTADPSKTADAIVTLQ